MKRPKVSLKVLNEKLVKAVHNDHSFYSLADVLKSYLEACGIEVTE